MEAPDGRKVDDPSGPPGRFQPRPAGSIRLSPAPEFRRDQGEPAPNLRTDLERPCGTRRTSLPARPPPKAASVAVLAPSPCLQVQAVCGRSEGV